MKLLGKCAVILGVAGAMLMGYGVTYAGDQAGVRQFLVPSQERRADLDVTAWYPADAGGEPLTLGESVFFMGTPAMREAPIRKGTFPVILISHGAGLGGNAEALSWLAAPLARRGFVVVAPTHPGNTGENRSAEETMKLWLRPADIAAALNAVSKNAFFEGHIELGKTGVLGLSMGGSTALAIAGARFDPGRLARYCDTDALNPSLCAWVRQSGFDLHAMNMEAAGRDHKDTRIGFAMAIDPVPAGVFEPASLSQISIPVELINLGRSGEIPLTAHAGKIAAVIPHTTYSTIHDASHYSMFAECKPGAARIAEAEMIEEPICSDGGGRLRKDIHSQLIDRVVGSFSRALRGTP